MKAGFPSEYKRLKAIMDDPEPVTELPDGVTQTRQYLMRACNLYNLCVQAVDKAIAPSVPPIAQTPEFFQSAVATLFINASHMRFVDKMPSTPINGHAKPRQ